MILWCEHAWLGGPGTAAGVALGIDDGIIVSVETDLSVASASAEIVRGLTIPGLANVHSHAFQRALRGRTHRGGGTFWTWREQMYRLAASADPDIVHELATATFAEMALAGITCVGEFHYLHHGPGGVPYDDPNSMGVAVVEAAARAGVRLTLLDTCYLHGGIGVEANEVQRRFADENVGAWAERAGGIGAAGISPLVRTGAAVHSIRAMTPMEIASLVASLAEGTVLHAHLSEQPAENDDCQRAYGCTPTQVLADAGALGRHFTAVHATHLCGSDLVLLGDSGSVVGLCPTTERDLGDGIGPAYDLLAHGVRLALGSDSHAVIDPFEEMRAVELDERLASLARGRIAPGQLLSGATRHGHASLGWPEAGALAVGTQDLCVLGLDSVRLAGSDPNELLAAAVFAATASDVAHTMVAGRWVVRNGVHALLGDVPALLRTSISSAWDAAS